MKAAVHIDCFTVGLDDLTRKQQASRAQVLRVLKKAGRFSVFEASDNQVIARTMDDICLARPPLIETDHSCGYPWTLVKLTEAGEQMLAREGA